jgi:hypothetical protein
MDLTMMERVGDREGKVEGSCSTGQSPQWAVVPVEEEEVCFELRSEISRAMEIPGRWLWTFRREMLPLSSWIKHRVFCPVVTADL